MTEPRVFARPAELLDAVGESLGPSAWRTVTQEMVDAFARCTDDEQWIHVDVERAAGSAFGGTIAHGFLTLALVPTLLREIYRIDNTSMRMNYGLNKVRFIDPVRVGTRIRATARIAEAVDTGGRIRLALDIAIEGEGRPKPACSAEQLLLVVP